MNASTRKTPLKTHAAHASFITNIVIEHGPAELIGRMLLAADTAARQLGVFLSFAAFDELVAVNRANRETWLPLVPVFDPQCSLFDPNSALCLLGRTAAGEVVLTQAARFFDWCGTSLLEEATSLRMFYREPEARRRAGEAIAVTAPSARMITGRVAYTGAHWCRPDFRAKGLPAITPRIARALAIALWDVEFTCTFMAKDVFSRGVAQRAGYFNVEWGVDLRNTPVGTFMSALLWSDRNGIILDLDRYLGNLVDADIADVHRYA